MVQRKHIFSSIKQYYREKNKAKSRRYAKEKVHYAGRVYNEKEMINAVDAVLDFWLTLGKYGKIFEDNFSRFLGLKGAVLVNSGSSANLIAITTLMSNRLRDRLESGDEIITCSLGFPTTVAPIIQNGLVPVFIDCRLDTLNIDEGLLEKALSRRTRAVQVTHTLGNPCEMDKIVRFARKHGLYLIEDACDALGSLFDGKYTGTFGDIATFSFYPAHHITMGEGGAVACSDKKLLDIACSIRDWGRDCFCGNASGPKGACRKRFDYYIKEINSTYDHRYVYSDIGYNLKPTDIQAAIGAAQLEKLPLFIKKRKENFRKLYEGLSQFKDFFSLPWWDPRSDVSWFAFPVLVKDNAPFERRELVEYLEQNNIETRFIFGGNILNQPAYRKVKSRTAGTLERSNRVMKNGFFVGLYPGLDSRHIDYIINTFREFINLKK
jgi:CDP-6-deoxy-D-xylo-4-hexulose-3-dehydrase